MEKFPIIKLEEKYSTGKVILRNYYPKIAEKCFNTIQNLFE
ncbi:dNA binding domain, excisionase family protein [Bacteroides fragilis str. S38L3]|nr:dNA binding domain, excisionase family protein [Bacteroides fragilis str. S38L3]